MANEEIEKVQSIPYYCPNCNAYVGDFVPISNGEVRLDSGGWLIADASRHCHRCGRLIPFKAPRDRWDVVVARYIKRVQAEGGKQPA